MVVAVRVAPGCRLEVFERWHGRCPCRRVDADGRARREHRGRRGQRGRRGWIVRRAGTAVDGDDVLQARTRWWWLVRVRPSRERAAADMRASLVRVVWTTPLCQEALALSSTPPLTPSTYIQSERYWGYPAFFWSRPFRAGRISRRHFFTTICAGRRPHRPVTAAVLAVPTTLT